jgi:rhodanese-related sulfurtransferase
MSWLRSRLSSFAALFSLAGIYFSPVNAQTMDAVRQTIRKRFPHVPQLATAELAAWLADTNRPAPLLVDVRELGEFDVSHLPAARHLQTVDAVRRALASNAAPVVVYCSVGYRSSAFAEKLRRAGLTNVFNLEGSIFQWANEGRPVYRGDRRATTVHPYDRKWGAMLDAKLRAPAA